MPSRADVERFRSANRTLARRALRDLEGFAASLEGVPPRRVAEELRGFFPVLTTTYGDAAAALAADWYEDLRDAAGVRGRGVILGDPVPAEQAMATAGWASRHLFDEREATPTQVAGLLAGPLQRYVSEPGRATLWKSAHNDGAAYARVPTGATTCAFCLMLASRGAVYETERTAGGDEKFHDACDCVPTPIFDGDDMPEGYDPDDIYGKYLAARDEAGGGTKDILAAIRQQQGVR